MRSYIVVCVLRTTKDNSDMPGDDILPVHIAARVPQGLGADEFDSSKCV